MTAEFFSHVTDAQTRLTMRRNAIYDEIQLSYKPSPVSPLSTSKPVLRHVVQSFCSKVKDAGYKTFVSERSRCTKLQKAIQCNKVDKVRKLIARGRAAVDVCTLSSWLTPNEAWSEALAMTVQRTADINAPVLEVGVEDTPLCYAIKYNLRPVFDHLMATPGVDVNRPSGNNNTDTPFGTAITMGHPNAEYMARALLAHPDIDVKSASTFGWAVRLPHCPLPIVRLLLEDPRTRVAVNSGNTFGFTALSYAAMLRQDEVVQLMLSTRVVSHDSLVQAMRVVICDGANGVRESSLRRVFGGELPESCRCTDCPVISRILRLLSLHAINSGGFRDLPLLETVVQFSGLNAGSRFDRLQIYLRHLQQPRKLYGFDGREARHGMRRGVGGTCSRWVRRGGKGWRRSVVKSAQKK